MRNFEKARRIVIKIGTNILSKNEGVDAGYVGQVARAVSVTAKGLDPTGKEVRIKATELLAQALEHEINHLNGVLYIDQLTSADTFHKVEPKKEDLEAIESAAEAVENTATDRSVDTVAEQV